MDDHQLYVKTNLEYIFDKELLKKREIFFV